MSKRPWTPTYIDDLTGDICFSGPEFAASEKLRDKAPEMAELLIEQVKDNYGMPLGRLDRMIGLLKECGYDPTMDKDPAD